MQEIQMLNEKGGTILKIGEWTEIAPAQDGKAAEGYYYEYSMATSEELDMLARKMEGDTNAKEKSSHQ